MIMKWLLPRIILVCCVAGGFGCASLGKAFSARIIKTKPAIAAITLKEPYLVRVRGALGTHQVTLPPGRYVPLMEDDQGTYYYAPTYTTERGLTRIPVRGQGGIYLSLGTPPKPVYFRLGQGDSLPYIDNPDLPLDVSQLTFEASNRRRPDEVSAGR